eukprot:scaffold42283_cov205-Skeletonema_dohrnii-CCMP3373.AAC.1
MAQSCRFLSDACGAADRTPLMGAQHHQDVSEAASPQPSFDVLDGLLQDIVNMQHDSRGVQASISDNPASSSFDETDQMKSAELPSSDRRLSLDDSVKQDYDSGVQAFINHNPAPSFDETDEMKSAASPSCDTSSSDDGMKQDYDGGVQAFNCDNPAPSFDESDEMKSTASPCRDRLSTDNTMIRNRSSDNVCEDEEVPFDIIRTSGTQSTDSNSVVTPVSVTEFRDAANEKKMVEDAEELSAVVSPSAGNSFKPLSMNSLKTIDTPMKERRNLTPERSYTPSTQSSSDADYCDTANHDDESSSDSETIQLSNYGSAKEEVHPERKTSSGGTFGSYLSDFMGDMFGSAKEVANVMTHDSNVRRNNIDDRGPIKIGEKLYSHNEALKMWKKVKRNLEDTYAKVDDSGNDKFDTTTFFEKSNMYKENATRLKDKRRSRNEAPSKRSSKKQGSSLSLAQEKRLKKLMMKISLQEDESVTESVDQNPTPPEVVDEEVDSDNSSDGSSSCSSRSFSSSDHSYSAASSFERSEYDPSLSAWLPQIRPVPPITEDISVATPVSSTADSVMGSNYGVEVSSQCCKFVSGKAPSQLIEDAGGYKDVVHKPERVVSTRKPRNLARHGMGISSSKRRNSKPKEDKKKSGRSLKLELIKKSTK